MGPWWGPDGSQVSRPYGPIVAPLANSVWVPCGPPIEGPLGHPHGAHLWPVWTARVEPRWVHGGAQMGPTCIARMGPLWPPWPILRGPHITAPMGHPHGATCGPYGLSVWGPDGSMVGPGWVPRVSPKCTPCGPLTNSAWAPHGPPITAPTGHPHGAHLWPVWAARVGPRWVRGGARMGPTCIAQMGPLCPLTNSAWAPHGPPITCPTGHPHGTHLWPAWAARGGPRWVHGGARLGPTCIAQMAHCWRPTWGPQGHPHGANMGPRRYCWLGLDTTTCRNTFFVQNTLQKIISNNP